MNNNLKKIYKHFGFNNQFCKLKEEFNELLFELFDNNREKIVEEMADLEVVLDQFKIKHKITELELSCIKRAKIERTIERIESGYYKNCEE